MRLTLTANLAIDYSNLPTEATRNKQKAPAPLRTPQLEPHPNRLDLKENQLSTDILAMQRRIRESKQQSRNAHTAPGIAEKPRDHAAAPTSKLEKTADGSVRMSRKDRWEKLKLKEVQPRDLEAMDLTGPSSSLLAHPKGADVEYTEQERRLMKVLIEGKVSRWMKRLE
jgi:hypothetical protein